MLEQFQNRSALTYFMLFIFNPILILCFQNCSVVRLSDLKTNLAAAPVAPIVSSAINPQTK